MGILKVEHFWCCCTVRTGTLVLGNITWFGCALNLLTILYMYDLLYMGRQEQATLHEMFGLEMFINFVAIILSGSLIIGVLYKKPKLMFPYIVALGLATVILGFCAIGIPILVGTTTNHVALPFGVFFTFLFAILITIHCWLVVYTQYREMKINCGPPTVTTPVEDI